jgi:DNA polymerase-3 subunit epsilon
MKAGADGGGCFPTGRHYPGIAHLLRVKAAGLAEEFAADQPIAELPLVAVDTETTGRNPERDRVIELACVFWRQGVVAGQQSWLVNPGRGIPAEALAVHGISEQDVQQCPSFEQVAP